MVVEEVKRDRVRWRRKGASEQETTWSARGRWAEGRGRKRKGEKERRLGGQVVGADRDEFVSFHAGKLSRSPRPMIYWATMW